MKSERNKSSKKQMLAGEEASFAAGQSPTFPVVFPVSRETVAVFEARRRPPESRGIRVQMVSRTGSPVTDWPANSRANSKNRERPLPKETVGPDWLAAREGLEPPTLALGKLCSILLSYRATRGA